MVKPSLLAHVRLPIKHPAIVETAEMQDDKWSYVKPMWGSTSHRCSVWVVKRFVLGG